MNLRSSTLLLFFGLISMVASAQTAVVTNLFTLKGQLKNFAAKEIYVNVSKEKNSWTDTIQVDEKGNFYYQTDKIKEPTQVVFTNKKSLFFANLLVAPGNSLTITADCQTETTILKTKKITGEGAEASVYVLKTDSLAKINQTDIDLSLELNEFLARHNRLKQTRDSVWNVVFGNKKTGNKDDEYFREMTKFDNMFYRLDMVTYRVAGDTTMNYKETLAFIDKNIEPGILADIYNPRYITSSRYRSMMYDGYYVYLKSLMEKQGNNFNRLYYQSDNINIIASNYKGAIREKALLVNIRKAVNYARSFEEINHSGSVIEPLLLQLTNPEDREQITRNLDSKEKELLKSQIGKPAPVFTATDVKGKRVSMEEYKGSVILIDLWASWCSPCRAQTPAITRLFEKYKQGKRLTIMSVAVLDKPADWRLALEVDKPSWLQLYDTDKSVERLYAAYSIPKFIIVNKAGNIVSFDAPMPSDGNLLEKILADEMAK